MKVMQVTAFQLTKASTARLSHASYIEVVEWLKHWTAKANYKALITSSDEEGIARYQGIFQAQLVPSWFIGRVRPEDFEFMVSSQDVKDGQFWITSSVVWATWHPVKP